LEKRSWKGVASTSVRVEEDRVRCTITYDLDVRAGWHGEWFDQDS
jgi:hypothetical protein